MVGATVLLSTLWDELVGVQEASAPKRMSKALGKFVSAKRSRFRVRKLECGPGALRMAVAGALGGLCA